MSSVPQSAAMVLLVGIRRHHREPRKKNFADRWRKLTLPSARDLSLTGAAPVTIALA
jgi:hypothetical protein